MDWEREGLVRVRARLAMLLQKWGVPDLTVKKVEDDILAAHAKKANSHPLFESILERAPSHAETKEVVRLLTALWNLTIPKDEPRAGPKEKSLVKDLIECARAELIARAGDPPEANEEWAKKFSDSWVDTPQAELDGKTPRQVILEERAALGNSRKELGFTLLHSKIESPAGEAEGVRLANEARGFIAKGDGRRALESYEKAYRLLKNTPNDALLFGRHLRDCCGRRATGRGDTDGPRLLLDAAGRQVPGVEQALEPGVNERGNARRTGRQPL